MKALLGEVTWGSQVLIPRSPLLCELGIIVFVVEQTEAQRSRVTCPSQVAKAGESA